MTAETLQKAKELERAINELKTHLLCIEKNGVKKIKFVDRDSDYIEPKADLLPIITEDFVQLYVSKVQTQIKKLQLELDNL